MNIAFFGTPEFAVPILEKLALAYPPKLVITAPEDARKGLSPVHAWALDHSLPVLAPEHLHPDIFSKHTFDLFIIAAYGKILTPDILAIPGRGTLNVHPSLLPRHRGASPVQSAILSGDRETGVTIMLTDEKMDHGPIVAQTRVPITDRTDSSALTAELAEKGAELLVAAIPDYISRAIMPAPQDHALATFTKLLTKKDAEIRWDTPAESIDRMIRAYRLWPIAWTTLGSIRAKILSAHVGEKTAHPPGTPFRAGRELAIAASDRALIINQLQPESKPPMAGEAFLNGYGSKILKT